MRLGSALLTLALLAVAALADDGRIADERLGSEFVPSPHHKGAAPSPSPAGHHHGGTVPRLHIGYSLVCTCTCSGQIASNATLVKSCKECTRERCARKLHKKCSSNNNANVDAICVDVDNPWVAIVVIGWGVLTTLLILLGVLKDHVPVLARLVEVGRAKRGQYNRVHGRARPRTAEGLVGAGGGSSSRANARRSSVAGRNRRGYRSVPSPAMSRGTHALPHR